MLRDAERLCGEAQLEAHRIACRMRMGQILGGGDGEALVDEAHAWLAAQGDVDPVHFLRLIAPGFGDNGGARLEPGSPAAG